MNIQPLDAYDLAQRVGAALHARRAMLAVAESCTGGGIAKAITDVPGSSLWFDRGFVTYANIAKQEMLGVSAQTLAQSGAVSVQTVREMAQGALVHSRAQWSVAVSGIAGPGGGTPEKPVGTVCFAWSQLAGPTLSAVEHFTGERDAIRQQSVARALRGLLEMLGDAA